MKLVSKKADEDDSAAADRTATTASPFVLDFANMKCCLLLSALALGLLATACNGTNSACENVTKADWAPCDFDGRQGACESGVCTELQWPADLEEYQRIQVLCEKRSIEDCEDDARCDNLSASRFDPTLGCFEAPTEVGCTTAFRLCAQSITTAESPDGEFYRFSDTCLPTGWTEVNNDLQAIPPGSAGPCERIIEEWDELRMAP